MPPSICTGILSLLTSRTWFGAAAAGLGLLALGDFLTNSSVPEDHKRFTLACVAAGAVVVMFLGLYFVYDTALRAVECVAAHLRGFEEDSRSEVVFWIDELSIEFGCYCFICRGTCAVECVTAHLRGFEEDSRSEVVFWIEEWSIEFGRYCFIVEEHVLLSALQHIFVGLKRTPDQKLSSGLKSGQLSLAVTVSSSRNMFC